MSASPSLNSITAYVDAVRTTHPADIYRKDEVAKGYMWMIFIFQANRSYAKEDDILSRFNSSSWKNLFTAPADQVPLASWWTEKRRSPGQDTFWFTLKVPVPFSTLNTRQKVEDAIQLTSEQAPGRGVIGLHENYNGVYWELYPLEEFYISYDPAVIPIDSLLFQNLYDNGVIERDRPADLYVNNSVRCFTSMQLMKMWAREEKGNYLAQRHRLWGLVSRDTGMVNVKGIKWVKDSYQNKNNIVDAAAFETARNNLIMGGGSLTEGEPPSDKKGLSWWIYLLIILAIVGAIVIASAVFISKRGKGQGGANMNMLPSP
jgi:hypothetical protein